MTVKLRIFKRAIIEREIGDAAKSAKLNLRFDKVVQRLTGTLEATLAGVLPKGRSVVITVTAPIKHPAKTAETLEDLLREGLANHELCKMIHGNKVRVRPVTYVATRMPKVLVFVHNTASDATHILDIAESRLLQKD